MSDVHEDGLGGDRAVIDDFLAGRVTQSERPALFDDDILYFAIARVDAADPDWLDQRLQRTDGPAAARTWTGRMRDVQRAARDEPAH